MKSIKLSIIIVVLGLLCSCSKKPVCEYYPQETIFTDPEGKYTLLVDEKFYEDFPNVALVPVKIEEIESEYVSVRFQTCTEPEELVIDQQFCTLTQDGESSPYSCEIFDFGVSDIESYAERYNDYRNNKLDGNLNVGVCQNDKYILSYSSGVPYSNYIDNPSGLGYINDYKKILDIIWDYFRNEEKRQAYKEYMRGVEGPEFDVSVKDKNLWFSEYFTFLNDEIQLLEDNIEYKFCGFGTTLPRKCSDIDNELKEMINELEYTRTDIAEDSVFKKGTMTIDIGGNGEHVAQLFRGTIKYDGKLYTVDESLYDTLSAILKEGAE